MIQAWGFYIVLLTLPSLGTHQKMDQEIAREFRGPYESKAQCDYWQHEWVHHNGWLTEYGIKAEECVKVERVKDE